jgi:uncharacterized protein
LEEEIKQLIGLQDLDLEIQSIKKERDEIPAAITSFNEELKELETSLAIEKERFDVDEKEKNTKEIELKLEEIKLVKSREKLNAVKTTKEHKAALKEIEEHNKQNSILEERILFLLDELDTLRKTVEELESAFKVSSKEIGAEIEGFEKRTAEIEKSLETMQEKRDTLFSKIDQKYSEKYNRLINSVYGHVVVGVVKGVCTGCFMNLPPQLFNEMMEDMDLKVCPNCSRLIFFKDDETDKKG